jgi:hypothetical protein
MNNRRRAGVLSALLATVTIAFAVTGQPASADSIRGHLIAEISGQCLQPDSPNDFSVGNAMRIFEPRACRPLTFEPEIQQWVLENGPTGPIAGRPGTWTRYRLRTWNGNLCLDDKDGNTNNKAPVQLWGCTTSNTELWTIGRTFFGADELINARSGNCLQVETGPVNNGYIVQYACNSTAARPNESELFFIP